MTQGLAADRGWKMVWSAASGGSAGGGTLVDRVLAARGVADSRAFLDPSLMDLHDPGLLPGIERAAERLLGAARSGEPIVVYGDYDVDGITASAIVLRMLRALEPGVRATAYVPHRVDEGYGLNEAALRGLAADGARVVVSVDCGITAAGPARAARDAGLDLIITDHHNLPAEEAGEEDGGAGDGLPEAYALVHPRLPGGDGYPFGELCGAGVAYKLAWRMATMHAGGEKVADRVRPVLLDLLALAALGTVADVVPLVDENRVITRFGLRRCRTTGVVGLTALIEAAGLTGEDVDAEGVGFRLGPMLNASGRLGHASVAVELLTTDDRRRADGIARDLVALNEERKQTQQKIFEQAEAMAEAAGMTGDDRRAIVLASEDWHPGVVGIVCSRLVERYARPVILMQRRVEADGAVVCAGSGRSIDGFNLHGAVGACGDLLDGFGGHDMAIGLRVAGERFDEFAGRFVDGVNGALGVEDLVRRARYDCEATLEEMSPAGVKMLSMLSPFGRANPAVRLCLRGLRVDGRAEAFGKRGDHLGVRLRCPRSGRGVRTVGWRWGEMAERFRPGAVVDVLVEPKVSGWSGQVEPVLVDVRGADSGACV